MSFLTPFTALIAAAVAIPALLLLYVLKLRRRMQRMPSTMLWRQSYEDLEANVPWQRLRASPLLLLQLLALLLFLFALAEPVMRGDRPLQSRLILLIDNSASMNARIDDAHDRTRLDQAKDEARVLIDDLAPTDGQAMILSFASRARSRTGFESRKAVLHDALDAIQPTDETTNLTSALALADVFAQHGSDGDAGVPDVVLISDGGVALPEDDPDFSLRAGRLRYLRVGASDADRNANQGIVTLSARRDQRDPARALVFARIINSGPAAIDRTLTARINREPMRTESLRIEPPMNDSGPSGETSVTFEFDLPGGALIELILQGQDALASDDVASIVLPAPRRLRVLLVHDGGGVDEFLRELIRALDPESMREMTMRAYEDQDPDEIGFANRFDLVVFDRVRASVLPRTPSISFGGAPEDIDSIASERTGGRRMLSWLTRHPIMRHVALDELRYTDFGAFRLPESATALATGPDGPVIALLTAPGAEHVIVGFALSRSTWPWQVSGAVFVRNVVEHLTLLRTGGAAMAFHPGETITAVANSKEVEILDASGAIVRQLAAQPGESVSTTAPTRVGTYDVRGVQPPFDRLAVSVRDALESDLRLVESLTVNASPTREMSVGEADRRALWYWLAAAALALLVVEWLLYCRQLRG